MNGSRPTLIVGCGYTGLRLAARLQAMRFDGPIVGTTRSEERSGELAAVGVEPLVGGLTEREALRRIERLDPRLVVYFVPPRLSGEDPLPGVLRALKGSALEAFLYASSTSVYGDRGGDWVDETSEVRPDSLTAKARHAAEQRVLEAVKAWGVAARVCRITGIYGPGRTLRRALESGDYVLIEGHDAWVNRVHVEDLVSGLVAAWKRGRDGAVYNLTDDEPHRASDFANLAARLHGLPAPNWVGRYEASQRLSEQRLRRKLDSKRVRNQPLREELSVTLEYPSFRTGLPAAVSMERSGQSN
jgi:nucleoside-diphosphate-sugar epimerase